MKIKAIETEVFKVNEDILVFIEKYLPENIEGSILVVTSKIAALAEGRVVDGNDEETKKKTIEAESDFVLQTKYVCLTIKEGVVMANAGIDESNADNQLILLPADSFAVALGIRKYFIKKYKLKNLGVIITDSRCLPLRAGVAGVALGYAGFRGLKDYKGKTDIFDRPFNYSRVNVADSLATAAVLCMGEGNEQQPLAIISDAPVEYSDNLDKEELKIDIDEDIYGPMFRRIV